MMTRASFLPVKKSLSDSSSAFSEGFGDAFSTSTSGKSIGFPVPVFEAMFVTADWFGVKVFEKIRRI